MKHAILLALSCLTGLAIEVDRPNVIFILSDDQGYGDLGKHGHPLLHTPHLDQLWDESVRFDNFYVSPSCSPTRAALLTGKHEFASGVTHTIQPREHLDIDAITLPQLFDDAGYATGFIGKWHLGGGRGYSPNFRGFQWCVTNTNGPREHFDTTIIRNGKRFPTTGYREDRFFDEAETFIKAHEGQPFFLYLATYSPHSPYDAPKDLVDKYLAHGVTDKQAKYLGMIENIDQNVGRLRQFLKKEQLDQKTIIIYMNDNGITEGLEVYNAEMRGSKCTIWEGGSRAMSLWHWGDHWKPRTVAEELTAHLDVLPTLAELCSLDIPTSLTPQLEGMSLTPMLNGQPSPWHQKRILYHNVARWTSGFAAAHRDANCGVRQGPFLLLKSTRCGKPGCITQFSPCAILANVEKGAKKAQYTEENAQYHWGTTSNNWHLYNVKTDPGNTQNIAESHPELVATLSKSYYDWWDRTFDTMISKGGDNAKE